LGIGKYVVYVERGIVGCLCLCECVCLLLRRAEEKERMGGNALFEGQKDTETAKGVT